MAAEHEEHQATADSVSKKLTDLFNSLSPHERAVMGGVIGQAASAVKSGGTAPTSSAPVALPNHLKATHQVRDTPLTVRVDQTEIPLHVGLLSW